MATMAASARMPACLVSGEGVPSMNQANHAGGLNGHNNGLSTMPISVIRGVNGHSISAEGELPATRPCQRILVVEDDSDLCSLLCDLLNTEGYQTASSSDGLEAVKRVERDCPDAIVLDVMIPGLDGQVMCGPQSSCKCRATACSASN
jgi:CheY-like chemotaxis protein